MTEKTEIAMQTEDEKHVVIVQDESSLSPPTNLLGLDQTEINKILKDLEQQTQILTETSKKINMQKKIIKNLNSKVDDDDDDDEDEESDDDYESVEEEVEEVEEEDIRWTAMLKLLDAHRNISESVHKLIHEDEEEDEE